MLSRRQQALGWAIEQLQARCPSAYEDLRMVVGRPTVQDLSLAVPLFKDAASCLRNVMDDLDEHTLVAAVREFGELDAELTGRRATTELRYPANFPVLKETGLMLYSIVRLARPLFMLEAGVADGYSTALILGAMKQNGFGELHSFDIRDDVGILVDDRDQWHLHLSGGKKPFRDLKKLAYRLRPIDIFFHDSDHRFVPQVREYDLAEKTVKGGGFLISDDTDFSYAFLQRGEAATGRSALLLDNIKCSGVLRFA